jgi:hypothetical protein
MKFGVYQVELDRFKAEEAGLTEELYANHEIVVTERIFHLLFIPFFSLGRSYQVIREYGVYEITPEAISTLKKHKKFKSPWYSYSLVYILLSVSIIWGIVHTINKVSGNIEYKEEVNNSFEESRQNNIENLENLKVGDFINFKTQTTYLEYITHMRVSNITGNSIDLMKIDTTFDLENDPNQLLFYFEKNKSKFESFKTSFDVLNKMILTSYEDDRRGKGYDFFKDGELYALQNIFKIDLPCLSTAIIDNIDSSNIELNYIGESFKLEYIINMVTKDTIYLRDDSYSVDSSGTIKSITIYGQNEEFSNYDKKYLLLTTNNEQHEYYIQHYLNGRRFLEKIHRDFHTTLGFE